MQFLNSTNLDVVEFNIDIYIYTEQLKLENLFFLCIFMESIRYIEHNESVFETTRRNLVKSCGLTTEIDRKEFCYPIKVFER